MRYDPITDYRRAITAMIQWEQTAAATGSPLHHKVAATCLEIAQERARVALTAAAHRSAAERALLQAIMLDAMSETRLESSRAAIAHSLAVLASTEASAEPDAPGPDVLAWFPRQCAE